MLAFHYSQIICCPIRSRIPDMDLKIRPMPLVRLPEPFDAADWL